MLRRGSTGGGRGLHPLKVGLGSRSSAALAASRPAGSVRSTLPPQQLTSTALTPSTVSVIRANYVSMYSTSSSSSPLMSNKDWIVTGTTSSSGIITTKGFPLPKGISTQPAYKTVAKLSTSSGPLVVKRPFTSEHENAEESARAVAAEFTKWLDNRFSVKVVGLNVPRIWAVIVGWGLFCIFGSSMYRDQEENGKEGISGREMKLLSVVESSVPESRFQKLLVAPVLFSALAYAGARAWRGLRAERYFSQFVARKSVSSHVKALALQRIGAQTQFAALVSGATTFALGLLYNVLPRAYFSDYVNAMERQAWNAPAQSTPEELNVPTLGQLVTFDLYTTLLTAVVVMVASWQAQFILLPSVLSFAALLNFAKSDSPIHKRLQQVGVETARVSIEGRKPGFLDSRNSGSIATSGSAPFVKLPRFKRSDDLEAATEEEKEALSKSLEERPRSK